MKKVIAITGATKGIGRAIAEKFAQNGYHVAVCARNKEDLKQMAIYWTEHYPESEIFTFRRMSTVKCSCRLLLIIYLQGFR